MSIILNVIFIVLLIANLFATGYSCLAIIDIYDTGTCNEDVILALHAGVYGLTLVLILELTGPNINLATLLAVIAIVVNILVARLAVKINYKRNVKPYLQIKI